MLALTRILGQREARIQRKDWKTLEKKASPDEWRGALKAGLRACRAGRAVLLDHFGRLEKVESKFQAGLVSEADRGSEAEIIRVLREAFPTSEFLAEESFHDGTKVGAGRATEKWRWILDPLDGTTNYVHRFPIFCISLALEVQGDLRVAIIDVPMLGETYTAIRGGGAYVNGKPLKVAANAKVSDSLLATGFFAEDKPALQEQLRVFSSLVGEARGVRRAGAAAYDLCQVAAGVFDGFWERNLKPWDTAAGQLLVEEAGGLVITYEGEEHDPYKTSVIAGNPEIAREIQRRIRPV